MMKIFANRQLWQAVFWIWLVVLVILTALPGSADKEEIVNPSFRIDYIQHFILYAFISFSYQLAYNTLNIREHRRKSLIIIGLFILFAVITEVYQIPIPRREFNPVDLALNIAGVFAGIPAGRYVPKFFIRRL